MPPPDQMPAVDGKDADLATAEGHYRGDINFTRELLCNFSQTYSTQVIGAGEDSITRTTIKATTIATITLDIITGVELDRRIRENNNLCYLSL